MMSEARQPRLPGKYCLQILAMMLPFTGGCAHVNLTQVAYEVLRQEDCRMNQLEEFCTRTFASEYLEYERMRQEYLRSQTQRTWRVQQDPTTLRQSTYLN